MEDISNTEKPVLIIDDDVFLRDMYAKKFSDMGHKTEVAASAQEALEKLKSKTYSIVLLDLVMPGMDGFEFLVQAKEEDVLKDAKLIVLTNQSREEDIEQARKLGAHGYIVKASAIPSEVVVESIEVARSESDEMVVKQ